MKKLSLLLALVMLFASLGASALAEEAAATEGPTEAELLAQELEFALIEADGEQPRLTYLEGSTQILEVDGLKFKDMNDNGELDVYEDWRQETDARVADRPRCGPHLPDDARGGSRPAVLRQRQSGNGALADSRLQKQLHVVQPQRYAHRGYQHAE